MTAVIIALGIAVGLPALAWWVGGRSFWSRLRPGADADPWGDAMRRYRLSPAETARVEAAVNWGRRIDDVQLRAAAVAWARAVLEQQAARGPRSSWQGAAVTVVVVLAIGAGIAWQVRRGEDFPWVLVVFWVAGGIFSYWAATAPQRAIRLNSD